MPKAIGVSDEDYEFVRSQRKIIPGTSEDKESLIVALGRILTEYREMKGYVADKPAQ